MPPAELFAAFRWWVALLILGILAFPLTSRLLHGLPDRGYAFTKMVGLLIVGYIFWLLGTLGFLRNTLGGILLAAALLVALSVWAVRWSGSAAGNGQTLGDYTIGAWFRDRWRYVIGVELLFAVAFVFWVWARSQNPAIAATEKPMEFAFLNSAGRSPTYPPLDPWLSGFSISYYYFGYVMTSIITRLAAVPEQIGFNLAIAWLAAGTALGAFGVVYNLISADADSVKRRAFVFGLIAAISLSAAGNMEILLEVLHANDIGSDNFWAWLDVRDLNGPSTEAETPRYETSQWWWWRSSRVIHEYHLSGRPEEGLEPIAEFPAFSFVLGDLHPHVLALPFAFLGLAVAAVWWLRAKTPVFDFKLWFQNGGLRSQLAALTITDLSLLLFTALVLGGLSFLNTWDVLIYLFLIVGAFVLAQWRSAGRWNSSYLRSAITLGVILSILALLMFLPFYLGFRSQAGPPFLLPMTMQPTRLAQFLVIFALPLISVLILVATLMAWALMQRNSSPKTRPGRKGLGAAAAILIGLFMLMLFLGWVIALSPDGAGRVQALADELGLSLTPLGAGATFGSQLGWATIAIVRLSPEFLWARISNPALILLLALLLAAVVFLVVWLLDRPSDIEESPTQRAAGASLPFVLLIIGTAALLALGPEFVYLKDNFGQRLNTIFKFYYQAWLLFGVAAVYGLDYLLRRFRISGAVALVVYSGALLISLLFPFFAIQSRAIEYRGPIASSDRLPATLDGLDYLNQRNPDEYEALLWLRENVDGVPVILEAVGGQYSGFGRVSATTGLPTLLGWAGHEFQWRGNTPEPGQREPIVSIIYGEANWVDTADLLNTYDVVYIYYGQLERSTYNPQVVEKFNQNLEVAYSNNNVTIYRWQPVGKD